jgi:hypothetical protein
MEAKQWDIYGEGRTPIASTTTRDWATPLGFLIRRHEDTKAGAQRKTRLNKIVLRKLVAWVEVRNN